MIPGHLVRRVQRKPSGVCLWGNLTFCGRVLLDISTYLSHIFLLPPHLSSQNQSHFTVTAMIFHSLHDKTLPSSSSFSQFVFPPSSSLLPPFFPPSSSLLLLPLPSQECTTIFEHCLTKVCSSDTKKLETRQAIKAMFDSMLENFMYCKHEVRFWSVLDTFGGKIRDILSGLWLSEIGFF